MQIVDSEILQAEREKIIKILDNNKIERNTTYQYTLANLALTPYIYDDDNIQPLYVPYKEMWKSSTSQYVLHPYQIEILEHLENGENVVVSAPTSFGKTTSIFEYIARNKERLNKIIAIVPTNSLKAEYFIKLQDILANSHKVIDNEGNITEEKFCLILTHEKFIECFLEYKEYLSDIDLVIIDEIYKLKNEKDEDRIYSMSLAYLTTIKVAKQFVFMGPFIKSTKFPGIEKEHIVLNYFYSPVINEIAYLGEYSEESLVNKIKYEEKSMVYFSSKEKLGKAAIALESVMPYKEDILVKYLLNTYGKEICDNWYLIDALSKGIAINYNEIPNFIKEYMLNKYNDLSSHYNILLSTSTLLEGVNTSTKNLYITSGKNGRNKMTDFEFWNLVGRAGRLGEYKIGYIYYYGENNDFDKDNRYINLDNIWITEEENKIERDIIQNNQINSEEEKIINDLKAIQEKFELSNEDITFKILPTFGKIKKFIDYMQNDYENIISGIQNEIVNNDSRNIHGLLLKGITKKTKKNKRIFNSAVGYTENTILARAFYSGNDNKLAKTISIIRQGIKVLKDIKGESGQQLQLDINNLINTTFNLINNFIPNVYIPTVECLFFLIERDTDVNKGLKDYLNDTVIKEVKIYKKIINEQNVYDTLAIIPSLEEIIEKIRKEENKEIINSSDLRIFIIENMSKIEESIKEEIDLEYYDILKKKLKIKGEN